MTDYSFNMTAGTNSGVIGYNRSGSPLGLPAFGSIDAQPISGQTLDFIVAFSGQGYIGFSGDLTALLSGYEVWVDGVNYGVGDTESWTLNGGNTEWVNSAGPTFSNGVSYFIELRAPVAYTTIIITSGSTTTLPSDWSDTNEIHVIGGGAGGRPINGGTPSVGSGGGGGGASAGGTITGLSPGQVIDIGVGAGGTPGTTSQGNVGGDTWFNATSLADAVANGNTVSVAAPGGASNNVPNTGGAGGTGTNGVGNLYRYSGGNGGTGGSGTRDGGGGGGGGGGPNGAGANGGTGATAATGGGGGGGGADGGNAGGNASGSTAGSAGTSRQGTTGAGTGAGGAGGTGNTANNGSNGNREVIWTDNSGGPNDGATAGPGGGGGGSGGRANTTGNGGTGVSGAYGGGGGGAGDQDSTGSQGTGGAGQPGVIVLRYVPATGGGGSVPLFIHHRKMQKAA